MQSEQGPLSAGWDSGLTCHRPMDRGQRGCAVPEERTKESRTMGSGQKMNIQERGETRI